MLGGAIPLMILKTIGRKVPIPPLHQGVPSHLGDDGGGRDMSALGIASHDSGLGSRTMRNAKPVDKNMNRFRDEPVKGKAHRGKARVTNSDPVNLGGL